MATTAVIATLCAGLFAGAALYITLVEHPVRMMLGNAAGLAQFRPSYERASMLMAPLAVVGSVAGFAGWLTGGSAWWTLAAVLLGAVVPWTLIVVFRTNSRLFANGVEDDAVPSLMRQWQVLHGVRTALGGSSFAIMVALGVIG